MLYELRIYECVPGRLPDLMKRFDTITLPLWEKHGIKQAGFWTTVIGELNQTLYYFVVWELARRAGKEVECVRRGSGMDQGARRDREERCDRRQRKELDPGTNRVLGGEVDQYQRRRHELRRLLPRRHEHLLRRERQPYAPRFQPVRAEQQVDDGHDMHRGNP